MLATLEILKLALCGFAFVSFNLTQSASDKVMNVLTRRLELLKLEGLGLSQIEIIRELSRKAGCSERTVYNDFETRA